MASLEIIAHIRSDFPSKFGIPRQSGLVPGLRARIVFAEAYRDPEALRGLEDFSHIWLLWGFSEAEGWSPTVRPPRLGGNRRMGVFATRSPYRPNAIGLSSAGIERIELHTPEGPRIHIEGADLLDGTPIYDIKPYLAFTDSHPEARGGFADEHIGERLEVRIDEKWLPWLPGEDLAVVRALLAADPRPSYRKDSARVYGMEYKRMDVRFTVSEGVLRVVEIRKGKGS